MLTKKYREERNTAIKQFNCMLRSVQQSAHEKQANGQYITSVWVKDQLASIDKYIRADDPRLSGSVAINHEDGSHFFFNNAFCVILGKAKLHRVGTMTCQNQWLVVFSEHNGSCYFSLGDLSWYGSFPSS